MDNVLYSQESCIATIKINRPEVRNALSKEVIIKITEYLEHLELDPLIRVVVLTGAGDHFCAGVDLSWMHAAITYSEKENYQDAKLLEKMLRLLNNLNKPTICVVQGCAFAGAIGLIACCDFVIATENAKFCLSEVKLGLAPAVISPYVIAAIG